MKWHVDQDLQQKMEEIVVHLELNHIQPSRIFCYRTTGATARAYARIWAFPKIFQQVLGIEPAYVIEFLSEKFDRLSSDDQTKVIIHELLHIPKNFSGSLLPHKFGNKKIDREVDRLFRAMKSK
jgi:predicted metallopeptidase